MDLSVIPPEIGSGVAAPSSVQVLTDLDNPTKLKKAKQYIDLVKVGTRRTVLLLGAPTKQRAHWSGEAQRKVICTAKLGACKCCALVGIDKDVGVSHFEFYLPCATKSAKDRLYVQTTLVLTEDMYKGTSKFDGLVDLVSDGPERGHALELYRESKHGFRWTLVPRSPRALAHILPAAFDVTPWMRVRFGLLQDPKNLPTVFAPFSLGQLAAAPTGKVHELDLAPSDRQSAEEYQKVKDAIDVMNDKKKKWAEEDAAATAAAHVPSPGLTPEPAADEPEVPAPDLTPEPAADDPEPVPVVAPARAPGLSFRTPTKEVVFVPMPSPRKDGVADCGGDMDGVLARATKPSRNGKAHAEPKNGGVR